MTEAFSRKAPIGRNKIWKKTKDAQQCRLFITGKQLYFILIESEMLLKCFKQLNPVSAGLY